MKQILKKICSKTPSKIDEQFLDEISQDIDNYYDNSDIGRHSYADVSSYIYETEPGDYEYLIENLQKIYDFYKSKNNIKGQKRIFKLIDHIRLECNRADGITNTYLTEVSEEISQAVQMRLLSFMTSIGSKEEELNQIIDNQKNDMQDKFEKQTAEIDKINSNLISVLGIFGAIIVAFFGGLNLLGSILDNIGSISAYRLAFMALVCLQGLFNVIFMLLYCISKMTNKPLWSNCKNCTSCNGRGNKITCLYTKYPLVIVYNLISIWGMITLFVMYVVDKYDVIKSILKMFNGTDNGIIMFIASILLMITFECILILVAKWLYEKYKEKCNCSNNLISNNSEENINPHEIEQRQEEEV
ncbi:hypothetical protein [Clostridium butyricum]|uniref:hypothetical protein n=1 Tax=Clostridium butyricum TaxID=1492 RepID=UPI00374FAB26